MLIKSGFLPCAAQGGSFPTSRDDTFITFSQGLELPQVLTSLSGMRKEALSEVWPFNAVQELRWTLIPFYPTSIDLG